jgi:hypothetical protein
VRSLVRVLWRKEYVQKENVEKFTRPKREGSKIQDHDGLGYTYIYLYYIKKENREREKVLSKCRVTTMY